MNAADIVPLRSAGLSDAGIHDLNAVAAYFNFVNRVAQGLGVEIEDPAAGPANHTGGEA